MATATAYDQWEDAGMAFSDEELAAWSTEEWVTQHVEELVDLCRLLKRRQELPGFPKPAWVGKAFQTMRNVATWYCVAAGVAAIDEEEAWTLPSPQSKEGKALTKLALDLDVAAWIGLRREVVEADLRRLVTIGRRCAGSGRWNKAQKKQSNKVVNALVREAHAVDTLEKLYDSLPHAKEDKAAQSD